MQKMQWVLVGVMATLLSCSQRVDEKKASDRNNQTKPSATAPSLPGKVVARIGDTQLTVGDLQAKMASETPFAQARLKDPAEMKKWVDTQVKREVLAQEAFRRGYDKDPEAQATLKKMIVQRISREEYERGVKISEIDPAQMQTYFQEHEEEFNKPEMIRVSVVKIAKRNDPLGAKKTAEKAYKIASNPDTLEDRRVFKELVKLYSSDEVSRAREGDAQYLDLETIKSRYTQKGLDAIVSISKLNDVAPLVESDDAFWIFKKTGRRKPIKRTFDDVKSQIRNKLYREKKSKAFDDWIAGLKKTFNASIDEEAMSELRVGGVKMPAAPSHAHP